MKFRCPYWDICDDKSECVHRVPHDRKGSCSTTCTRFRKAADKPCEECYKNTDCETCKERFLCWTAR